MKIKHQIENIERMQGIMSSVYRHTKTRFEHFMRKLKRSIQLSKVFSYRQSMILLMIHSHEQSMLLIMPRNLQFSSIHPGESKKQFPFGQQLLGYEGSG